MKFAYTIPAVLALAAAMPAVAQVQLYQVVMTGANESPPVTSSGIGVGIVTLDMTALTMRIEATFAALTGTTTAAHIHCCTTTPGTGNVGVATMTPSFSGFPLGTTFGAFDQTYNMALASSYNAAFITNNGGTVSSAFSALVAGMDSGRSYFNIHTSFAPGGEIRGFLTPVPEPGTYALMFAGLAAVGGLAARRRNA